MFDVVLKKGNYALAERTARLRPQNVINHNPSKDPDADLIGALAEHAFAQRFRIPQESIDSSGGLYGRGDGGWDFEVNGQRIDIKASGKYPGSWVVPKGDLRADLYVFAFVDKETGTVSFRGKATKQQLEPIRTSAKVGGKRLVYLAEVDDVTTEDFRRKPRRQGLHPVS